MLSLQRWTLLCSNQVSLGYGTQESPWDLAPWLLVHTSCDVIPSETKRVFWLGAKQKDYSRQIPLANSFSINQEGYTETPTGQPLTTKSQSLSVKNVCEGRHCMPPCTYIPQRRHLTLCPPTECPLINRGLVMLAVIRNSYWLNIHCNSSWAHLLYPHHPEFGLL